MEDLHEGSDGGHDRHDHAGRDAGDHHGGDAGRGRCPLCLAREVGRSVGPDVVSHLVAAGRELALAVGAALDAHAAAHADRDPAPAAPTARTAPTGGPDAAPAPTPEDRRGPGSTSAGGEVRRLRRIPVE